MKNKNMHPAGVILLRNLDLKKTKVYQNVLLPKFVCLTNITYSAR